MNLQQEYKFDPGNVEEAWKTPGDIAYYHKYWWYSVRGQANQIPNAQTKDIMKKEISPGYKRSYFKFGHLVLFLKP